MLRPLLPVALLLAIALAGCSGTTSSSTTPAPASTTSGAMASNSTSSQPAATTTSSSTSTYAPRAAKTFEIDIKGNAFVDGTKTIQKGDSVHWVHMDGTTPHSVVSDEGKFTSDTSGLPCPGPGCMTSAAHSTFDHTFDEVGTYAYHCEVHAGMKNTLTVVAALPS